MQTVEPNVCSLRNLVCGAMIVVLPLALVADDTGAAMLHNQGGVFLNGNPAPPSSAVFRNDTIQTQQHFEAKLDVSGSTATVLEDSLVQYEDNELVLDHGAVMVTTSRSMAVRVGCLTVVPVKDEWTQFVVTDKDGKVTVDAQKLDVNINARRTGPQAEKRTNPSDKATVREGEHATREERCAVFDRIPPEISGKGAILNSAWVKWPAAAGITAGTLCLLLCTSDEPISPAKPNGP